MPTELRWLAVLGGGLGLTVVYFTLDPAFFPFPRCPFLLLTGLYCPGCGSQRALHALLHGELGRAVGFNLLAVLSLPLLVASAVAGLQGWLAGEPRQATVLYRPWLGWLVVGVTMGFAVLRNLPGPAGHWLAP